MRNDHVAEPFRSILNDFAAKPAGYEIATTDMVEGVRRAEPIEANPFAGAPLLPLADQIENVEAKLAAMIRKAETGEQWAEICAVEARELVPLLKLQINAHIKKLHDDNIVCEPRTAAGSLD